MDARIVRQTQPALVVRSDPYFLVDLLTVWQLCFKLSKLMGSKKSKSDIAITTSVETPDETMTPENDQPEPPTTSQPIPEVRASERILMLRTELKEAREKHEAELKLARLKYDELEDREFALELEMVKLRAENERLRTSALVPQEVPCTTPQIENETTLRTRLEETVTEAQRWKEMIDKVKGDASLSLSLIKEYVEEMAGLRESLASSRDVVATLVRDFKSSLETIKEFQSRVDFHQIERKQWELEKHCLQQRINTCVDVLKKVPMLLQPKVSRRLN